MTERTETEPVQRIARAARRVRRSYEDGADRPLGGYLVVMGGYLAGVGSLALAAARTGRRLPQPGPWDVVLTACAVRRLSRLIAKDPGTSPLRAPFTRYQEAAGAAEVDEEVRGEGTRHAIGELLTCPFCTGLWVATALVYGEVFAPGTTRLAAAGLTALTGADLLHFVRSGLQRWAEG